MGGGRPPVSLFWWLSLIVTVAALAVLIVETHTYYVNIPFSDEWLLTPFLALRAQHALTLSQLTIPHNEHIPFFPRLLLVELGLWTHWNFWYECVANIVLGLASLAPLLYWIRRDPHWTATQRAVLSATVSLVVLSLNQWENWMWGWQAAVFLCTAALTWGIFALSLMRPTGFIGLAAPAVCGIVATLSFANGLLYWPATLPLAWRRWRSRPLLLATWLAVGGVTIAWYLWQLHRFSSGGGFPGLSSRGVTTALRVLGSSLAAYMDAQVATVIGFVGLTFALLLAIGSSRNRREEMSPASTAPAWAWFTLLLFGLLSMLLIALGRRLPLSLPVPARYLTFANFYWIGLAVLLVRMHRGWLAVVLMIAGMVVGTSVQARRAYVDRHTSLQVVASALFSPIDNGLLGRVFWNETQPREWLKPLRDLHLSVYDCARQLSKDDWSAAARLVARYARADDLVVTSSDWGARCLDEHLRTVRAPGVRIVSARESQAGVLAALDRKAAAFTISAGDVTSLDAKAWIERHGAPLYRSPIGSLRLFYYPDRVSFIRDRLRPEDIAVDRTAFDRHVDLMADDDQRFFPWGWERPQTDRRGRFRSIVIREASIYVPVVKHAPRRLDIAWHDAPILAMGGGPVTLTLVINGVPREHLTLTPDLHTWTIDLSTAAWQYGANIVNLSIAGGDTESRPEFAPLLDIRSVVFNTAGR